MHGPISETPREGADACCGNSPGENPEDSRIMVGRPENTQLRVLSESASGVVLELETGGFYAEPQEDGTVKLEVPGSKSWQGGR